MADLYNETSATTDISTPIDVSLTISGSDIIISWTNTSSASNAEISIFRSDDEGKTYSSIVSGLPSTTETYTDSGAASIQIPYYKIQVQTDDIADNAYPKAIITQPPSSLQVSEEIPRIDVSWTNSTTVSEYYTLIYRNQQNRLQGVDTTNEDNYNIVGAVSSTEGTEIPLISDPNQSEPSNIQTIHDNLDGSGTSSDPYVITNDYELQSISVDPASSYILGIDIDASGTTNWNGGSGFNPINTFTGTLDGDGFEILGLSVNRGGGSAALCSSLDSSGVIKNIGFKNVDINGSKNASGTFSGDTVNVAGIVADNSGTIQNAKLTGSVEGFLNKDGAINASGDINAGGIAGINSGSIIDSYAIAAVDGYINADGSIDSSYTNDVGGIVGENNGGTVTTSYSAGSVTGNINTSSSIGLSANNSLGGLIARNTGSAIDSYWDTQASGQSASDGGTGLTTSEMQGTSAETNMAGFDFTNSWETISADYPDLIVDKEPQQLYQYSFEDYGTDYETAYSYITNVVTADVFAYSDEKSTGTSVDTFDWEESWGATNWSQEEISPLDTQDKSTLNVTIEEWDTNSWGLDWETAESVEDEPILNKSGYKLTWTTRDNYEDVHFIYRSTSPGLTKEDYELVGATEDDFFFDNGTIAGQEYYYRIGYVDIDVESAPSNTATITTGIPVITDTPALEDTIAQPLVTPSDALSQDEASIQQIDALQPTIAEDGVAHDQPLVQSQLITTQQTPSIATTLDEGTTTSITASLLQQEFTSSFEEGTLRTIEGTSISVDAETVAFEIEIPTDVRNTSLVTTESSNVLDTPSPIDAIASPIESTDAVEITNAVTEVTSATATASAIASGDEQTSATDAALTQDGAATSSESDEFSSNQDGGQITPAAATASPTPSLSAVTDGGFAVAESTSSLTPSVGGASEDAGITVPILASTIESTETTRADDTGIITAEFETSVAPVVQSIARDTPINTDAVVSPISIDALTGAINTPLVTQFSSAVAPIDADTRSTSARVLTNTLITSLDSTEFAASLDESSRASISIVDILADDTSVADDAGITSASITIQDSPDEITRELNEGNRVNQQVQTIDSTEQTSAQELSIPEPITAFTFTTASEGIALSPSVVTLLSVNDIQSTESSTAQELAIPEAATSSPILVDAFTQSFEDNDLVTEKVSTPLATTDSLEDSASLSQVNSTISQVSTLSVENGFSSATDRGSIVTEAEKSIIASEEITTALDEGIVTDSSIQSLESTEFTFSVDAAGATATSVTPIVSLDEFASTIEEGVITAQTVGTFTDDAFTFSVEDDRLQQLAAGTQETPSVGIADTTGLQELLVSPLAVDAFTFSIDGTIQSQTVTPFEINGITSAFEEGSITSSSVLTAEDDAFTLSNEFDVTQPIVTSVQEINAQTSAITEGLSLTEAATLTFDEFTSAEEEPLVTNIVGTAGTVAENITFGDTAIARDAAGDEDMSSISLAEDAETIAYEQPTVTQMVAETLTINAATFAAEEGSITTSDAISSDTPSRGISREDNRETNATYSTFEVTATTSAIEEGTRTLCNNSSILIDADTSALEEGSLTEKIAESSITASVGITLEEGVITNTEIETPTSFESLTPIKDITEITSETGTTSLTTRDPEVTRAFERSRQPDLVATPIQSPDEETSAVVKRAVLPVEMQDVVQKEFASAGDTPLVETISIQTFGDGQAVVNQDIDELDVAIMEAAIPQAGVGINPVVTETAGLFTTFQSEETFVITSFLAEPRITAFSKQEDPLDAGAVRAPSIVATEDSTTNVELNDSETNILLAEYATELEVRNNGI